MSQIPDVVPVLPRGGGVVGGGGRGRGVQGFVERSVIVPRTKDCMAMYHAAITTVLPK